MDMEFHKYEGAGNDFILIDDRTELFPRNNPGLVRFLCDRRFGIGADGLMLLQPAPEFDFQMVYYNSDGNESSMCGNGGRCIAAFARTLGIMRQKYRFMAVDGEHLAVILSDGQVRLKMVNVTEVESGNGYFYLDTGSPHYVKFVTSAGGLDVFNEGRKIRYNERFKSPGTNVNFVEDLGDHIFVRTYERGVENETLACGTGVVASAICSAILAGLNHQTISVPVKTKGGLLKVSFKQDDNTFTDIWLEGPATFVFKGTVDIRE